MQSNNYYTILGINPDAPIEEIKRAYRQLALRYHPDRNPEDDSAGERFKMINEAYDVLIDENKRRQYDLFGHVEAGNMRGGGFPYSHQSFQGRGFCRGMGGLGKRCGMGMFFHGRSQRRHGDLNRVVQDFPITFEEAMSGVEKEILIARGGVVQNVIVRIPAGVKEGSILQMRGKDLKGEGSDILLRITLVD